jgi:hypothetical protein
VQGSIPVLLVVLLLVAATVLGAAALAGIFALVTVKERARTRRAVVNVIVKVAPDPSLASYGRA